MGCDAPPYLAFSLINNDLNVYFNSETLAFKITLKNKYLISSQKGSTVLFPIGLLTFNQGVIMFKKSALAIIVLIMAGSGPAFADCSATESATCPGIVAAECGAACGFNVITGAGRDACVACIQNNFTGGLHCECLFPPPAGGDPTPPGGGAGAPSKPRIQCQACKPSGVKGVPSYQFCTKYLGIHGEIEQNYTQKCAPLSGID
jgi:hypothetical protein